MELLEQLISEKAALIILLMLNGLIKSCRELFYIRGAPLMLKELAEEILEETFIIFEELLEECILILAKLPLLSEELSVELPL